MKASLTAGIVIEWITIRPMSVNAWLQRSLKQMGLKDTPQDH